MPVGPYETFQECVDAQKAIYRKKNPEWTEEHLEEVAGGVCYTIEQRSQSSVIGYLKDFASLVRKLMHSRTEEYPNGYPREVAESIAESIAQDQASLAFTYLSDLGEVKEDQGKLIVPIHVISKGENLNKWGVTDEARRNNAESLKTAVLLGPPDENHPGTASGGPEGSPHEGMWHEIDGKIIDFVSNGVTYGIASIEDPYAIENIKNGDWEAVSPSVEGLAHRTENGGTEFTDFKFQHVLFLPKSDRPAYPKAGAKGWIEQAKQPGSFEVALAAAMEELTVASKDETNVGTRPSPNQVARSRNKMGKTIRSESPLKDGKTQLSPEEMVETIQSQAALIETLQKDVKVLKEASTVKKGSEDPKEKQGADEKTKELEAKVKALETFQAAVATRDHALLVEEVLQAEKHAGMIADDKAEKVENTRLNALSDAVLSEIKATTEKSAAILKSLPPSKKAEAFEETSQVIDAKERIRQALFGHKHDKDGKEVT